MPRRVALAAALLTGPAHAAENAGLDLLATLHGYNRACKEAHGEIPTARQLQIHYLAAKHGARVEDPAHQQTLIDGTNLMARVMARDPAKCREARSVLMTGKSEP